MKLAPKYRGFAYAATVTGIASVAMAAVISSSRWMPVVLPVRAVADSAVDPEILRLERAVDDVKNAALRERAQRSIREDGSDSILPLYTASAANAASADAKPFDASAMSFIVMETARGRIAIIDGMPVRNGERMPDGSIVRSIERTGLVIEDGTGALRKVDIRDRFVRENSSAPTSPNPMEVPPAGTTAPAVVRPTGTPNAK